MDDYHLDDIKKTFATLFQEQKFKTILEQYETLQQPQRWESFIGRIVAASLTCLKRNKEALELLLILEKHHPENIAILNAIGETYKLLKHYDLALTYFQKPIELEPKNVETRMAFAKTLNFYGNIKLQIEQYKIILSLEPQNIVAHYTLGSLYHDTNQKKQAIIHLNKCIQYDPHYYPAHLILTKLNTLLETHTHIQQMEELQKEVHSNSLEVFLYFALGNAYEQTENFEQATKYFTKGNKLKDTTDHYDFQQDLSLCTNIKNISAMEFPLLPYTSKKSNTKQLIYILGLPRSGTSLIEHILSSHSEVFAGGETSLTNGILRNMNNKTQPYQETVERIRQAYQTHPRLQTTCSMITDKMPSNFLWIGMIQKIFPDAKIIHSKRDPIATCWSLFKNYFTSNHFNYAYNIENIAKYYALYQNMITHWQQEYPHSFYTLNYETLTENQEEETRKLLEYCGLDFEESCLNFHENKNIITTASSLQLRQEMYQNSSNEWKKYKEHTHSLITALKNEGII